MKPLAEPPPWQSVPDQLRSGTDQLTAPCPGGCLRPFRAAVTNSGAALPWACVAERPTTRITSPGGDPALRAAPACPPTGGPGLVDQPEPAHAGRDRCAEDRPTKGLPTGLGDGDQHRAFATCPDGRPTPANHIQMVN